MKITKKHLQELLITENKKHRLTVCTGLGFQLKTFENDLSGNIFYNKIGSNKWVDTGLTATTKKQFIQSVYNYLS